MISFPSLYFLTLNLFLAQRTHITTFPYLELVPGPAGPVGAAALFPAPSSLCQIPNALKMFINNICSSSEENNHFFNVKSSLIYSCQILRENIFELFSWDLLNYLGLVFHLPLHLYLLIGFIEILFPANYWNFEPSWKVFIDN